MEEKTAYVTEALELIGMTQPKQIIQEISGFVPVFDALLEKYDDHITAIVFGRRWQYCRMEDGVCRASLETIANDLKMSKATVMRHTDLLVADGYLIDLTPDARNVPHVYADAGKIVMKNQLTATVSQRNTSVSQRNATVSESHLIKQDIKRSIKQNTKGASAPKATKTRKPVEHNGQKLSDIPELVLYYGIVHNWGEPHRRQIIIDAIRQVRSRLGRDVTAADLEYFWVEWCKISKNAWSLKWLAEWAVAGRVLGYNEKMPSSAPQQPVYSQADRELRDRELRDRELRDAILAARASR